MEVSGQLHSPAAFPLGPTQPPVRFEQGAVLTPEPVWMRGYCGPFTVHTAPTPYSTVLRLKLLLPYLRMKLHAFPYPEPD
jgi:hypothetical protein